MRRRSFLPITVAGLVLIGLVVVIVSMRVRYDRLAGDPPATTAVRAAPLTPATAGPTASTGIPPTTGPSDPEPSIPVETARPVETVVMEPIKDTTTPATGPPPVTKTTTTTTTEAVKTSATVLATTGTTLPAAETTTTGPAATLVVETTAAPTTRPAPDCAGTWRAFELVTEQCIIDQATARLTALFTGDHATRMSAIRGGHVLGEMLAGMHAWAVERVGAATANNLRHRASFWIDADTSRWRRVEVRNVEWSGRPYQISAAWRVHLDTDEGQRIGTWWATPLVPVDGDWLISYLAWCRWAPASEEGKGLTCPPEPDPGWVASLDHDGYLSLVHAHHNNGESGTPDYAIGW